MLTVHHVNARETIAELEVLRDEKELQETQEYGQSGTDAAKSVGRRSS